MAKKNPPILASRRYNNPDRHDIIESLESTVYTGVMLPSIIVSTQQVAVSVNHDHAIQSILKRPGNWYYAEVFSILDRRSSSIDDFRQGYAALYDDEFECGDGLDDEVVEVSPSIRAMINRIISIAMLDFFNKIEDIQVKSKDYANVINIAYKQSYTVLTKYINSVVEKDHKLNSCISLNKFRKSELSLREYRLLYLRAQQIADISLGLVERVMETAEDWRILLNYGSGDRELGRQCIWATSFFLALAPLLFYHCGYTNISLDMIIEDKFSFRSLNYGLDDTIVSIGGISTAPSETPLPIDNGDTKTVISICKKLFTNYGYFKGTDQKKTSLRSTAAAYDFITTMFIPEYENMFNGFRYLSFELYQKTIDRCVLAGFSYERSIIRPETSEYSFSDKGVFEFPLYDIDVLMAL